MTLLRNLCALVGCGMLVAVLVASAAEPTAQKAPDGKYVKLFNGKNLDGWHGDKELWKVVDGAIVGSTDDMQLKQNSFLITDKPYKNFVLKAKFKLRNGNSGIQFRSKELEDFVVAGYQADMADKRYMGILYDEKGSRGVLSDVKEEDVKPHLKPAGEWNEYIITANGPRIKQELNGFTTVDYEEKSDKAATEGIIALQVHTGPKMRVEFKDLEIMELP